MNRMLIQNISDLSDLEAFQMVTSFLLNTMQSNKKIEQLRFPYKRKWYVVVKMKRNKFDKYIISEYND